MPYTPSPSGYVRVLDSTTKHEIGYYMYVDPRNGDSIGAPVQFTRQKSEALFWELAYSISFGGVLYGYKPDLILAGKTNPGTEINDTVVMGVPTTNTDATWVQTTFPDAAQGSFTIQDLFWDNSGIIRNISQLCHTKNAGLANPWNPVLVLSEKLYPDCSKISLSWKSLPPKSTQA